MNFKNNKKPLYYYYAIGIVFILLLQFIIRPLFNRNTITEVSFDTFINMLNEKKINKVEEDTYEYRFSTKDTKGNESFYRVGKWSDPEITKKLIASGAKFGTIINKPTNPIIVFLVSWVIPIAIFILMGRYLSKMLMGGAGGNSMSFGKANAKVYVKAQTGITFNDVAGQEEAKESLVEVVDFLHNPKKYSEIGAVSPKGILLVGPPGTGKTLLAKAVAGEADVPFFSISGSEFVEMFVGMGAAKVRDLFKQANQKAPCIVFIDEIDALGKRRDASGYGGNDEREQTLNQLLNEMDGFDASSGVIILAATNRPEILDQALTRPGRFDRQVRVELPDLKGREDVLKVHAKKVKMSENVNLKNVAKMTAGCSGADLANIINEGALRAVREDRKRVTEQDLIESVEVVIAGAIKKNSVITQKEKDMIAYHEVGHALVAALQKNTAPVTKITIIPRTSGTLGYTMQVDEEEKVLMSREDLFAEIVTLTGGRSAEELIFNTKTTGASNDIQRATKIARSMVAIYGMEEDFDFIALEVPTARYLEADSKLLASDGTAKLIDERAMAIIADAHKKAFEILKENINKLHEISSYLLEKETISGEEFMDILNNQYVLTQKPEYLKNLEEKMAEEKTVEEGQIQNKISDQDFN